MYRPASFAEDRAEVLHALIRRHPLATLIACDATAAAEGVPAVEHIPMLLADEGPLGVLRAHVARANPVWRVLAAAKSCIVVFQGAEAYVSPVWYPSKAEHGKVVPTWNYAIVHVTGVPRVIDDAAWLRQHVEQLTITHENSRIEASTHIEPTSPWQVSDAPTDYITGLSRAVVGIEIPIASMQGKYKLSQNRPPADQAAVIAGMLQLDSPEAHAVAALMQQHSLRK